MKQDKARLFALVIDPFATSKTDFGTAKVFMTVDFQLPPVPLSEFKKAELIFSKERAEDVNEDDGDESKLEMVMILQYEEELWSVSLTTKGVPNQKLLPDNDFQMLKRHIVRGRGHENCIFVTSFNSESLNYRLMMVSVDFERPGYCKQDLVYELSGYLIITAMADPELSDFIYILTEE